MNKLEISNKSVSAPNMQAGTSEPVQNNASSRKVLFHKLTTRYFWKDIVVNLALYLLLLDLAFVFLYPFLDMIITSLKTEEDLLDITVQWIPSKIFWQNYKIALDSLSYTSFFKNSVVVTILATVGHVLSCSCIAYGFARYRFKGSGILFGIVVLSMIVPVEVLIFPLYMMYSRLGWLNTFLPLTVPAFFGFGLRGGLFIFLFRQFFIGLPYEIEEAARIDGCGPLRTFSSIMLPMSQSSILVSIVLSLVWHWNDFFEPSMYLFKPKVSLLPARLSGIISMFNAEKVVEDYAETEIIFNEAIVMAAIFLVILPILIVYAFLQKRFMEGIERSGLTGQ